MTAIIWKNEVGLLKALDENGNMIYWEISESRELAELFNNVPLLGQSYIRTAKLVLEKLD